MMLHYAILAVIQGITEFLPVSSSGHLVLFGKLFGFTGSENMTIGILLHAGSLFAIVAFYFKTLIGFFKKDQLHLMGMVILGSVPAGVAGVTLELTGVNTALFNTPAAVGLCFWITATVLRFTSKPSLCAKGEPVELKKITLKQTLIIGFAQMFATPAICGAILLEMLKLFKEGVQVQGNPLVLIIAVVISAVTSYGALKLLVNIVKRGKLVWFSWYLYAAGAVTLFLSLRGAVR